MMEVKNAWLERLTWTHGKASLAAMLALLGCGALLAVSTNLAKFAHQLNIIPSAFLLWSLAGATVLLFAFTYWKGEKPPTTRSALEYYVVAALLSVAGSNLIFFSAVAKVGVGFVAMAISLPPLLTYLGALMLGMETLNGWRVFGVLLALLGTLVLVSSKWSDPASDSRWIVLTLCGPVLLAAGNLYRSRRWPTGGSPRSLAPGMLAAATVQLFAFALLQSEQSIALNLAPRELAVLALQSLVFAGQFLMLFILQRVGGPVFLSLLGSVSAVLAVPLAMWWFDEPLLSGLLPSALLIGVGVISMLVGQSPSTRS